MNDRERHDGPSRGRSGGASGNRSEEWTADEAAYEPGWYALANRAPVSEEYQVFHPKASRPSEPQLPPRRGLDELLELLVGSADPDTKRAAADAAIGLIQGIGIDEGSFDHLLLLVGRAEATELPDPATLARLGGVIGSHRLTTALDLPDERRTGAERLVSALPPEVPAPPATVAPTIAGADPDERRSHEAALDRREASLIEREAAVLERENAVRAREAALADRARELEARAASLTEPEAALNGSRNQPRRAG
jgi:hypothetical protein